MDTNWNSVGWLVSLPQRPCPPDLLLWCKSIAFGPGIHLCALSSFITTVTSIRHRIDMGSSAYYSIKKVPPLLFLSFLKKKFYSFLLSLLLRSQDVIPY
jgi:hypothetical protein